MHIQTSADARQSKWHGAVGQPPYGAAASGRGFFASVASMFKTAVGGHVDPPASTADTNTIAGLRGSPDGRVPLDNGDVISASPGAEDIQDTPPDAQTSPTFEYSCGVGTKVEYYNCSTN